MRDKEECTDLLEGGYQILLYVHETINMFSPYYLNLKIMRVEWDEITLYITQ